MQYYIYINKIKLNISEITIKILFLKLSKLNQILYQLMFILIY